MTYILVFLCSYKYIMFTGVVFFWNTKKTVTWPTPLKMNLKNRELSLLSRLFLINYL